MRRRFVSSCFISSLTFRRKFSFNSCHRFSIGLQSGDLAGVFHQLIPFSAKNSDANLDVCLGSLHKTGRSVRIYFVKKWLQRRLQDVNIHSRIHLAFKNTDSRWSPHANASPHMYLHWVLRSRIKKKQYLYKYL